MRRAEMARRRRNLSEKRNEEVKACCNRTCSHVTGTTSANMVLACSKKRSTSSSRSKPVRRTARVARLSARMSWARASPRDPTPSSSGGSVRRMGSGCLCQRRSWRALLAVYSLMAPVLVAPALLSWPVREKWSRRSHRKGQRTDRKRRLEGNEGQSETLWSWLRAYMWKPSSKLRGREIPQRSDRICKQHRTKSCHSRLSFCNGRPRKSRPSYSARLLPR